MTDPVYYDPYDFEIDVDPYPVWRRMRDEAPLYYNEKFDFFALSRFQDVEQCLRDWRTYRSGKGSVLDAIKLDLELPSGFFLMEDPPEHDVHRSLMSRVFTPRRMAAVEPHARAFCAETLDPRVGSGGFDFVKDLGAYMPMRMIGMLLGIPEENQEAIRDSVTEGLKLGDETGQQSVDAATQLIMGEAFGEYIDWRVDHPSDDLMTDLLNAEFEDETGTHRKLRREEILTYVYLIASAGNETTTRLIGWTGKLLAEHPDQRQAIVDDLQLVPGAIEEILRYEAPAPALARTVAEDVEWYGSSVPEGSAMVVLIGSANRDDRKFENGDKFDITRTIDHHLTFGYGLHFCLGAALARLEGRVALEEVIKRFPKWEVDWDNAVQAHTSAVRGWGSLPVLTN